MVKRLGRGLLVALFWVLVWEAAALAVGEALLLPSPWATLRALARLALDASFWKDCAFSVLRILSGFGLGALLGILTAVLTSRFSLARALAKPLLSVVKAAPVASFILLALVWLKTGQVPVFAAFLVVFPLVWGNVSAGIAATDKGLLEMTRAFGMGRGARLWHLYRPSVLPYFRAAVATGMGMAWKAGVAAEVICTPRSAVGSLLYNTKIYLDTEGLFAVTAVVILLSVALEKGFVRLVRGKEGAHA